MPIKPPRRPRAVAMYIWGERAWRRLANADLNAAREIVRLAPLNGLSGDDAELAVRIIAQCFATGREQAFRLVSSADKVSVLPDWSQRRGAARAVEAADDPDTILATPKSRTLTGRRSRRALAQRKSAAHVKASSRS
jgi:hypothetical protein